MVARKLCQRLTMHGDQGLVGGHDGLACLDGRFDSHLGGAIGATDQLDKDIDRLIFSKTRGIVEPAIGGGIDRAVLALVTSCHPGNLNLARQTKIFLALDQINQPAPDIAEPCDPEFQRIQFAAPPACMASPALLLSASRF